MQAARQEGYVQVLKQFNVLVCFHNSLGDCHSCGVMGSVRCGDVQPCVHLGALLLH